MDPQGGRGVPLGFPMCPMKLIPPNGLRAEECGGGGELSQHPGTVGSRVD